MNVPSYSPSFRVALVEGFGLGFRGLGFRGSGFRGLGVLGLGFRVWIDFLAFIKTEASKVNSNAES